MSHDRISIKFKIVLPCKFDRMITTKFTKSEMQENEERQRTLVQLADMFSGLSNDYLQGVCEQQNWNVELCIDQLISAGEGTKKAATYPNTNIAPNGQVQHNAGAIPKNNYGGPSQTTSQKYNKPRHFNNNIASSENQKIVDQITAGFRVMVIMRGAPGSGKSYLAHELVERTMPLGGKYTLKDYVLSTDDFFYDSQGHYKYSVQRLEDAHAFNQRRVRDKTAAGWSPIIIDNTNMMLWEIMPYVQAAMRHGYLVELLEPKTPWRYSAGRLSMLNSHRVPREKIKIMLDKYENGCVADIMKMLKNTKYTVPLPQMRAQPPIMLSQQDVETEEKFQIFQEKPSSTEKTTLREKERDRTCSTSKTTPKQQRENIKMVPEFTIIKEDSIANRSEVNTSLKLFEDLLPNAWEPFEKEATNFWEGRKSIEMQTIAAGTEPTTSAREEKTLLELLKEGVREAKKPAQTQIQDKEVGEMPHPPTTFKRHKVSCRNECKSFASLRQIYPNKQVEGLWDLFVKCNGDIDWAVDLLLKEDELSFGVDVDQMTTSTANGKKDVLSCDCDSREKAMNDFSHSSMPLLATQSSMIVAPGGVKPQRQRGRAFRSNQRSAIEVHDTMRETIENCFVLGDEHYSKHVRKVRDGRIGIVESLKQKADIETQTDFDDEAEENQNEEILEVALGEQLIKQLSAIFSTETTLLGDQLPQQSSINVFMPRTLAKELYMLWVESAYNQIEEQRQQTLREDESFARLLKIPKYEHCKQSPSNIRELLDMEMAWMIYNSERKHDEQPERDREPDETHPAHPTDLAAHLTLMKLCEIFPDIPRETLLDILVANGNRFAETVEVLHSTMNHGDDEQAAIAELKQDQLFERALRENELLAQQADMRIQQQQHHKSVGDCYSTSHSSDSSGVERNLKTYTVQPDEAKRLALRDFEEMRNLSAHHCQLKAECYQKAKEAIQKGNSSVAVYYSQIANLHKRKVDMFNHRAANCIMDVHKYTQNNPDLLDLHYLYVLEAACCLDLFLDRHITGLRTTARSYKNVFIITGRGLHSVGGVSTIKNKVRSRLKERNLRWNEVNPGLLKVKIFSASRHSKNI